MKKVTKKEVEKWFNERAKVYFIIYFSSTESILSCVVSDTLELYKRGKGFVEVSTENSTYYIHYKDLFESREDAIKHLIDKNLESCKNAIKWFYIKRKRLLGYLEMSDKYYLKKEAEVSLPEIGVIDE